MWSEDGGGAPEGGASEVEWSEGAGPMLRWRAVLCCAVLCPPLPHPCRYPFDIPSEAFTFLRFKQAFAAIQASIVHLQVRVEGVEQEANTNTSPHSNGPTAPLLDRRV